MNTFTHMIDADSYWTSGICPKLVSTGGYYRNEQLSSQFRSSIMSALEYEVVSGLMDGMSMENLAKFRKYVHWEKVKLWATEPQLKQ